MRKSRKKKNSKTTEKKVFWGAQIFVFVSFFLFSLSLEKNHLFVYSLQGNTLQVTLF